jgi:hypothetical protein
MPRDRDQFRDHMCKIMNNRLPLKVDTYVTLSSYCGTLLHVISSLFCGSKAVLKILMQCCA